MNKFRPDYFRVWFTFLRNSLVREMTFRGNFVIEVVTRAFWFTAQLVLFEIIYQHVPRIQDWSREEYFAFMATAMLINGLVEMFFMPNCAEFSELVRKGDLDFLLLKPIDTQFLVSLQSVELASLSQILLAGALLSYSLWTAGVAVSLTSVVMYLLLIVVGVTFFYSLMITLAATSVWLGRNQGLYDFWFYITVFARYPQNVYRQQGVGEVLWFTFSFLVPILLVVTVPARLLLQKALEPNAVVLVVLPTLTLLMMYASRRVFLWSLAHYRSASS